MTAPSDENQPPAVVKANRLGAMAMVGAMACFIVNDTLVKYVSQTMPASQLIFLRSGMAALLVLAVAHAMGATAHLRELTRGWLVARAAVDAMATMLYLWSLFHLPIANATAIGMTSPLIITILAAMLMGEHVGATRILAIVAGFVGVVLIVQPRAEGFNVFALVCLFATVLIALRDLMIRRVHVGVPSMLVILSTFVSVTILAGALSLFEEWRPFAPFEIGLLGIASILVAVAYYLLVSSTRSGEFSFIAPFRYSGLLFATLAGYAVWNDQPNGLAWCGIALLIASGISILRASSRAAKRAKGAS